MGNDEMKIIYVAYYDNERNKAENRNIVLAATNKIDYICSAINRGGYEVEIVSASGTKNRNRCKGHKMRLSESCSMKLFPSGGYSTNKFFRVLRRWTFNIRMFFYLLSHIKCGQTVIVYHSLGYAQMVWLLKKLKKFNLILEVEEIYSDVTGNDKKRKMEFNLFNEADAYIFPTELLDEKVNRNKRKSIIVYGTYKVEEDRKCRFESQELKGKINLLYAGTFDPRKGGGITAAVSASELNADYHVHIIGFGNEEDKKNLISQIEMISRTAEAGVTYDGLYMGEEYIRFVQCCQVGLSTQMPDAAFNETSFPSKVLSYLANGLRVVSVRIEALERSSVGHLLYYYDEQTPEAIAEAVKNIDFSEKYDSREVVRKLDDEFVKNIRELLSSLC